MISGNPNIAGYNGLIATINIGQSGLFTDAAQSNIPATALIRANNVTYYNQILEKDYGSRIWNSIPCPAPIVRAQEMYPDSQSQNQRLFALCSNGQIFKFPNYFTQTPITPDVGAPTALNTNNYNAMVVGGNELVNNPKKLFVFDGYDIPQVISGDTALRHNISMPAADWTGTSQPFGGVIHKGAMYAWGNTGNPHAVYASSVTNHEDFQTIGAAFSYNIYPGEYDGIVCGCVFRGRLYVFKYPLGLYYLVDTDSNRANWFFTKHSDDFGACSPQSATVALNDLIVANNYGSFTSLLAALVFGDTIASDIFHTQGCFRFSESEVRPDVVKIRSMVYYSKKQQILCTFQSNVGNSSDRIAVIDFKNPQKIPRIAWINKDKPNCLFLVRNAQKIPKPFYGSSDGNFYEMDVADRWVGSATDTTKQSAYLFDCQTPFMNFSNIDASQASQEKEYEFIEIEYEPTGDWDVSMDVFIDQRFQKTYTFNLSARSSLNEMPLNASRIDGLGGFYRRQRIYGKGRTISLRFYNGGLGQDVRLVRAYIYYRLAAQSQTVGGLS